MTVSALGDSAVVISISDRVDSDTIQRVRDVVAELERNPPAGVVDIVPAFGRVALFLDPISAAPFSTLRAELLSRAANAGAGSAAPAPRQLEIPVCYGGEHGPDLERVASTAKKTAAEVVTLHSSAEYDVQAIGFAPGFP